MLLSNKLKEQYEDRTKNIWYTPCFSEGIELFPHYSIFQWGIERWVKVKIHNYNEFIFICFELRTFFPESTVCVFAVHIDLFIRMICFIRAIKSNKYRSQWYETSIDLVVGNFGEIKMNIWSILFNWWNYGDPKKKKTRIQFKLRLLWILQPQLKKKSNIPRREKDGVGLVSKINAD